MRESWPGEARWGKAGAGGEGGGGLAATCAWELLGWTRGAMENVGRSVLSLGSDGGGLARHAHARAFAGDQDGPVDRDVQCSCDDAHRALFLARHATVWAVNVVYRLPGLGREPQCARGEKQKLGRFVERGGVIVSAIALCLPLCACARADGRRKVPVGAQPRVQRRGAPRRSVGPLSAHRSRALGP